MSISGIEDVSKYIEGNFPAKKETVLEVDFSKLEDDIIDSLDPFEVVSRDIGFSGKYTWILYYLGNGDIKGLLEKVVSENIDISKFRLTDVDTINLTDLNLTYLKCLAEHVYGESGDEYLLKLYDRLENPRGVLPFTVTTNMVQTQLDFAISKMSLFTRARCNELISMLKFRYSGDELFEIISRSTHVIKKFFEMSSVDDLHNDFKEYLIKHKPQYIVEKEVAEYDITPIQLLYRLYEDNVELSGLSLSYKTGGMGCCSDIINEIHGHCINNYNKIKELRLKEDVSGTNLPTDVSVFYYDEIHTYNHTTIDKPDYYDGVLDYLLDLKYTNVYVFVKGDSFNVYSDIMQDGYSSFTRHISGGGMCIGNNYAFLDNTIDYNIRKELIRSELPKINIYDSHCNYGTISIGGMNGDKRDSFFEVNHEGRDGTDRYCIDYTNINSKLNIPFFVEKSNVRCVYSDYLHSTSFAHWSNKPYFDELVPLGSLEIESLTMLNMLLDSSENIPYRLYDNIDDYYECESINEDVKVNWDSVTNHTEPTTAWEINDVESEELPMEFGETVGGDNDEIDCNDYPGCEGCPRYDNC